MSLSPSIHHLTLVTSRHHSKNNLALEHGHSCTFGAALSEQAKNNLALEHGHSCTFGAALSVLVL